MMSRSSLCIFCEFSLDFVRMWNADSSLRASINVTGSGDPAFLLRVLAPSEADFADEASGVHVRFRLGGESWPPTIFYKVFTHRNVADIGAFAPRDYSHEVKVKQGKKRAGVKEPDEGAKDMALYVRAPFPPPFFSFGITQ